VRHIFYFFIISLPLSLIKMSSVFFWVSCNDSRSHEHFFSCACATFKLRWINCIAIHTRFYVFVRKLLSFILLWNSKWAAYDSRIRNSSHRITAIIIIIASWHCFVTFYFTSIIASILIHETCLKIALNGNWFEGNSWGSSTSDVCQKIDFFGTNQTSSFS